MHILERDVVLDWLRLIQSGGDVKGFFFRRNISDIIIYGAGALGLKLYEDIRETDINVHYFIDKSVRYVDDVVTVYTPACIKEVFTSECSIIVTSVFYFPEIYDYLREELHNDVEIFSIEDIIYDGIINMKNPKL